MPKFLRKFKAKKWLLAVLLIACVAGFLVAPALAQEADEAGESSAGGGSGEAGTAAQGSEGANLVEIFNPVYWLSSIAENIISTIIRLEGWAITALIFFLEILLPYSDFVNAKPVVVGWTLVRDLANLFFVLILLVIAIGTILRVESYNFKKLLPKVIIMAVMVNFSRTIAGLAIDFSQVMMLTFFAGFKANFASSLISSFSITNIFTASKEGKWLGFVDLSFLLISGSLAIIMLLIVFIVVFVMFVVVFMRMVMLWLLVILSPLPFLLSAFPQGQRYAQQWWEQFTKYLIVGPAIAFFLWLTLSVMSADGGIRGKIFPQGTEQRLGQFADSQGTNPDEAVFTNIGRVDTLIYFMVTIGLLMGGLMITQQLGVAGGSLAGNMYGRIRQAGIKGALLPFKGIRTVEKAFFGATGGIGLNPMRVIRGLGERYQIWSARMERQGGSKGSAMAQDFITKQGVMGLPARALGMGLLMTSSPKEFAQNYLGIRGMIRFAKTMALGTSKDKLEEWNKEKDRENEEIDKLKRFGDIDDVTEKGKDVLVEQTAEQMQKDIEDGKYVGMVEEDGRGGYKTTPISKRDLEKIMENITEKDLKDYGLLGQIFLKDSKEGKLGKGIVDPTSPDSEDNVKKFKEAFFAKQGEVLVKQTQQYVDSSGALKNVTPAILKSKGQKYYRDALSKKDDEIRRVGFDGITDIQLDVRQGSLEKINKDILNVLEAIKARRGLATDEENEKMKILLEEGNKLGGVAISDTMGMSYFGTSASDKTTQKISHANITGVAARTKGEKERIDKFKEEDSLGRTYVQYLGEQRQGLAEEERLANLDPDQRRAVQDGFKKMVKYRSETLDEKDKKIKRKAISTPIPYEALAEMRAAEREQLSKLPDSMEWTEIESELRTAIQLKNQARVRALMKKAAVDYNDNEIWLGWGYSEDSRGMKKFGDEVLRKQLGMKEQEMLKFMDDLAYINEDKSHYETARMVTIENGMARWATEGEHAAATTNENLKKPSRAFLQNTNRLGYGGEDPELGHFKLSLAGKLTLAGIGDQELQYRLNRGEFNPSTLSKIALDTEGLKDMVSRGWINRRTMEMIGATAASKKVQADYKDLIERTRSRNI